LSEKRKLDEEISAFQSHRHFWNNSPGAVLRTGLEYVLDPLRMRIYDENIKGEFAPEMLDVEKLVKTLRALIKVVPCWMETYFNVYHLLMWFPGWRLLSAVTYILWGGGLVWWQTQPI